VSAVVRWFLRGFFPVAAALALCAALTGCMPKAKTPIARHIAHGAMLAVAYGVRTATDLCLVEVNRIDATGDEVRAVTLAEKCRTNYKTAYKALNAAAWALDGWGNADANGKAVCAVAEATVSLRLTIEVLRQAGVVDLPREVGDGLAAASFLADQVESRVCEVH
jgi:hypothetical protein